MKAVKEKPALPHCTREESARILKMRDKVREISTLISKLHEDYISPEATPKSRERIEQKFQEAQKEISSTYSELLRTIFPIVQKAPESREDPLKAPTHKRAEELYLFWRSYFEYPSASWNLANLCMKLAEFEERAGEPEKARTHYKEAISRCKATAEIIRGSDLGYGSKVKLLVEVENLQFTAATKAHDEQEEKRLNASRAMRMAFSISKKDVLTPHPNVSHLLSMYYGPEIKQKDMTPILQAYFKFSPPAPEKKKQEKKFND